MALPDPEKASTWGGRTIVDRAGATIGPCIQVYTDDATGLPEWAAARMGDVSVVVPLVDAVEDDGQVRVTVTRDEALRAPAAPDRHHIREDDEEGLYRHYGIPFSRDASDTVLPDGEGSPRTTGTAPPHRIIGRTRLLVGAGVVAAALAVLGGVSAAISRRTRRRAVPAGADGRVRDGRAAPRRIRSA